MSERIFDNLVVIEGGDGSGKGTQAELTREYLSNDLGRNVLKLSFPQYENESSYYVGKYLNGAYGSINEVDPELASLAYMVDRVEARDRLIAHLELPNSAAVLDRYVDSNSAHQATKIKTFEGRKIFYERSRNTEFITLGQPKPRISIVLLMPTHLAQLNVDKKDSLTRSYTDRKRDIHEEDADHLELAKANYEELCLLYPDEFSPIQCVDSNADMKTKARMQLEVRQIIDPIFNSN